MCHCGANNVNTNRHVDGSSTAGLRGDVSSRGKSASAGAENRMLDGKCASTDPILFQLWTLTRNLRVRHCVLVGNMTRGAYVRNMSSLLYVSVILTNLIVAFPTRAQTKSVDGGDALSADESNPIRWLPQFYRDWLIRDVSYIITKEERRLFLQLTSDEEREDFIKQFWRRRNPDPESHENLYELEYYRRIAYANEHFSAVNLQGWATDRGRVYITFGQPDQVQTNLTAHDGPEERWRYRYLEGIGGDIELTFADPRHSGDYQLVLPAEDREILFEPWDPDLYQRSTGRPRVGSFSEAPLKFRDLEIIAAAHVTSRRFESEVSVEELPATPGMSLVDIRIEVPPFEFQKRFNDSDRLHVFCSITDANRRFVQTLEDTISPVAISSAGLAPVEEFTLQKTVPLRPGSYDLAIVLKDPASQDVATIYSQLVVSGGEVPKPTM